MTELDSATLLEIGYDKRKIDEQAEALKAVNARIDCLMPAITWADMQRAAEQEQIARIKTIRGFITQRIAIIAMTPVTVAALAWIAVLTHHIP